MKDSKKLISARIDPETIKKIEAFCEKRVYWKRNNVIDRVLYAVFNDFDEKDIYDMVRRPHWKAPYVLAKYKMDYFYGTHKEHEDGKDS